MADKTRLSHYSKTIIIFMVIASLLILSFNFYNFYNITKNPPSDMWSKETCLGTTVSDTTAKLIKEDDRILVVYQTPEDLVISLCNIYGQKIKDLHYSYKSSDMRNLMFFKKDSSYHITYNYDNITMIISLMGILRLLN